MNRTSAQTNQAPMAIVVVGHVDHGKSTLVGRLLHETGSLPEGKIEYLKEVCDKRGMPFEWAFVMDALQAERDQGITIDTSRICFRTDFRPYVIIDAPGHKEFLKNMVSGAASADAAVLVIDAIDGVQEQSRRHGYLLHLLGLKQIAVAINKMDLVDYSESRFVAVKQEIEQYLATIGLTPSCVVPVSARAGDNVKSVAQSMPWYHGPSVLGGLDAFTPSKQPNDLALRLPVQDIYKFDSRRIIAGRIESGRIKVGDQIAFAPSGKSARIAGIVGWAGGDVNFSGAEAGQSVGITLDEPIFVERGQIAHLIDNSPMISHEIHARVIWLGREPLQTGERLKMKLGTGEYQVELSSISRVIDVFDLTHHASTSVERNAVVEVVFRSRSLIAFDGAAEYPRTGRFVLVRGYDIVGGGIIASNGQIEAKVSSANIFTVNHKVTTEERAVANGHHGGVLWMTGLSGAGKSTLAMELERRLFHKGWQVAVLDGDNVRHGLCSDLGFSAEDRAENIRRVSEVAHLLAQTGILVITAFISPYRDDRDRARAITPGTFHEVYLSAGLETCERRDPKGLYRRARSGEIPEFTGISAPYEPPEHPDLIVDTHHLGIDEATEILMLYVQETFLPLSVATVTSTRI